MNDGVKIKSLHKQVEYLKKLKIDYNRNILISRLKNEIESLWNKKLKFNYVKHHMNIDIYEIIWKDLYGHMNRIMDTMNENNVIDMDMIDLSRSWKFAVKKQLIAHWILKSFRKNNNSNLKT